MHPLGTKSGTFLNDCNNVMISTSNGIFGTSCVSYPMKSHSYSIDFTWFPKITQTLLSWILYQKGLLWNMPSFEKSFIFDRVWMIFKNHSNFIIFECNMQKSLKINFIFSRFWVTFNNHSHFIILNLLSKKHSKWSFERV